LRFVFILGAHDAQRNNPGGKEESHNRRQHAYSSTVKSHYEAPLSPQASMNVCRHRIKTDLEIGQVKT